MSNEKEFFNSEFDSESAIEEKVNHEVKLPSKFHVYLLNDDFTPMDFVVDVLCRFFNKSLEQANDLMLTVHYEGKALCGIYTADIAETKVDFVTRFALENEHPLKCVVVKA